MRRRCSVSILRRSNGVILMLSYYSIAREDPNPQGVLVGVGVQIAFTTHPTGSLVYSAPIRFRTTEDVSGAPSAVSVRLV